MQPFSPEFVAIIGWHTRTTAVAITDFLGGVGKGQVSRVDRSLVGKTAAGSYGSRCAACRQGDRSFNPRQVVWPLSALAANGKSRPSRVVRGRRLPGEVKLIAAILFQPVIGKILTHLGLQARAPPRAPARGQALQAA